MSENHPEIDEKALSNENVRDGGDASMSSADPPPSEQKDTGYANGEHDFDTGLKAWLQVFGAFFLFFNSWYVTLCLPLQSSYSYGV
jgi:hypothetical protein